MTPRIVYTLIDYPLVLLSAYLIGRLAIRSQELCRRNKFLLMAGVVGLGIASLFDALYYPSVIRIWGVAFLSIIALTTVVLENSPGWPKQYLMLVRLGMGMLTGAVLLLAIWRSTHAPGLRPPIITLVLGLLGGLVLSIAFTRLRPRGKSWNGLL